MKNSKRPRDPWDDREGWDFDHAQHPEMELPIILPQPAMNGPAPIPPIPPALPLGPSATDVQGSYTGVPMEGDEQPVQDADDL